MTIKEGLFPPFIYYYIQLSSLFMCTRQVSRYSNWLRAGRYGDRIPVEARFSAPVQTGPGAHPAPYTKGTGSFPGVKSGRGVTLSPPPFQCRGHEIVELYFYFSFYFPYGLYGLYRSSVPVQGCTLPHHHNHRYSKIINYTTSIPFPGYFEEYDILKNIKKGYHRGFLGNSCSVFINQM